MLNRLDLLLKPGFGLRMYKASLKLSKRDELAVSRIVKQVRIL